MPHLAAISCLVRDYDEAIDYFVGRLGFELLEDTKMNDAGKRFVRVRPPVSASENDSASDSASDCGQVEVSACLLLAKPKNSTEEAAIGNQTGGRVFFFLHTDNFERDYKKYLEAGVEFIEKPRYEEYGNVVVFRDLYGNLWDLVQPLSVSD